MSYFISGLAGSHPDGLLTLAYLDPGTGSFALQMILASLFGGLFALKQSWAGFKAWFSARGESPRGIGAQPLIVEGPPAHGRTTAAKR